MMRLTTAFIALAAWLCWASGPARAESCTDDAAKLLQSYSDAKAAFEIKGCTELDAFLAARTAFANFLDGAVGQGCDAFYVSMSRLLVAGSYQNPPTACGTDWKARDNRQLQYDAIAVMNQDIGDGVFIDGDAVVLKQAFRHEGNHTLGFSVRKCARKGADADFAIQCAGGQAASEQVGYSFDATLIDPGHIYVMDKSALAVETGTSAATPEDLVESVTQKGSTSDATRVVLNCLLDISCVQASGSGVKMKRLPFYCDPETCNDALSHLADMIAMMRRKPN